jgi:murein DD-endopeptidase MepM/ murein hydrolase activator NlpD
MAASVLLGGLTGCAAKAPERKDILLPLEHETVASTVPEAATFESLLRAQQIDPTTAQRMVTALRTVFNPRNLRADQPFWLIRTLDGAFTEFRYEIDATKFLRIVPGRAGAGTGDFAVDVVDYPREVQVSAARAEIDAEHNSLSAALDAGGENIQLALLLSEVFGGIIDFNSDLQRGDRFEVLFERVLRDGQFAGYGELSAAKLYHGGKEFTAVRAKGPDGRYAWYDETGRSMKRAFLASPLPFDPRVTSGFSLSRKHPVYGFNRAHLGVDYHANYGTKVMAVANGTVVSAGWAGDGGQQIRIRHNKTYETYYLHLSRFAPGIRAGASVSQGQVIGYVGATGAATGPHLDFRIKRSGTFVNPVLERQRMPPGEPIPSSLLPAFMEARDRALADLTRRVSALHAIAAHN